MKTISNLTEEEAVAVAAAVVTFRAVRSVEIARNKDAQNIYRSWVVEVETYAAEESTVNINIGATK